MCPYMLLTNASYSGVVARGIPKRLAALDCDEFQGFLFSPALPASEIDKVLNRRIRFGVPAEAGNAA